MSRARQTTILAPRPPKHHTVPPVVDDNIVKSKRHHHRLGRVSFTYLKDGALPQNSKKITNYAVVANDKPTLIQGDPAEGTTYAANDIPNQYKAQPLLRRVSCHVLLEAM